MRNRLNFSGRWVLERYRRDGAFLSSQEVPNDIMLAQIDDLLDVYFDSGNPPASWSIGLIGGTSVSITTADSMSSHAGWTEDQNYTEATRPAWSPNPSASQIIENSTSVIFTLDTDTTIRGAFLTSDNTKGGAGGELWSAAALDTPEVGSSGQTIRTFYSLEGSGV